MSNPAMQRCIRRGSLLILLFTGLFAWSDQVHAQATGIQYVTFVPSAGAFQLSGGGKSVPLVINSNDEKGAIRALKDLQTDITAVTKSRPELVMDQVSGKDVVIVGTIGKSPLIDGLIKQNKINAANVAGKWETFLSQVVDHPLPGVDRALVIAGSDKRGTIYGIYDLSQQIGVSPWYWWADVPVKPQAALYIRPGMHSNGTPAVKYRGIFINDEAPAFSGWTKEKFGGVNHSVYEKMFELILRLKGNYLWPAMWGNAFNDDDKLNPVLADEYGIVMGTSHHEPMDRAQTEWKRYGSGTWNYEENGQVLRDFWKKGIENMGNKETIVTIGMRGDGDKPMTEGSNISLLEKIVADQRKIIAESTGKKISDVPQMWALYKEVQDYYDKGMRVPDDVTLLLCDDNWGNIRKLPKPGEAARAGGYGIYYHFDYVGGPRNYKWLNTNPISKVQEQMNLAYEYGAKQVWIVNVGDLKPMEFPISFFLDYAWSPKKYPANSLDAYTTQWAQKQFGSQYAAEIAGILTKYTRYNGRRKPELLDANTYSLTNYNEFENVVNDYNKLKDEAEALKSKIPAAYQDAYFELVLHPVQACANLNELYISAAKNKLYASQGRASANDMAAKVKTLFDRDAAISEYYNKVLANGKWNHMMDQTHIGYTYWQEPRVNKAPDVATLSLPETADMGIALEGSDKWWPNGKSEAILPVFDLNTKQAHYLEIFNRGKAPFAYTLRADNPAVHLSSIKGTIDQQERIWVSLDWAKVSAGTAGYKIYVSGPGQSKYAITIPINTKAQPTPLNGFAENDGYVAMEAGHYTKAINTNGVQWARLPGYGRTSEGVTPSPVTAKSIQPEGNSPHLEYLMTVTDTGNVKLTAYISPTIDFTGGKGLHYAISIDNEVPQIVNINADLSERSWNKDVADNIKTLVTKHHISKPGLHTIKYWMVDPAVVLQRIVVDFGGVKPSYLGPPESGRGR